MVNPLVRMVESNAKVSIHSTARHMIQIIGDSLQEQVGVPPRAKNRAETESHLVKMIEATPDFIVTMDVRGHVLYCNPAVRQMLGIGRDEEITSLHITDIYSARSCATLLGEGVFIANLDGAWRGEAALRTGAGREVPVSQVILAPAEADRRGKFLALIARDVQPMKQAEATLRESEQFYRGIAEAARVGIWVMDTENQTSFVNPRMANMLGYRIDEMLGKPAIDFISSTIALPNDPSQFMIGETRDLTLRRKDGEAVWVNLCPSPLFNEQERYTGTLAMVTEIAPSGQVRGQAQL